MATDIHETFPYAWPVVGPSKETGPPMSAPHEPPAWWAHALLTD